MAEEVTAWAQRAARLAHERSQVTGAPTQALQQFTARLTSQGLTGQIFWRTLNLRTGDTHLVTALARGHQVPGLSADARRALDELNGDAFARALNNAKTVLGVGARRMFAGEDKKDAGARAAEWLAGFHGWLVTSYSFAGGVGGCVDFGPRRAVVVQSSSVVTDRDGVAAIGSLRIARHRVTTPFNVSRRFRDGGDLTGSRELHLSGGHGLLVVRSVVNDP